MAEKQNHLINIAKFLGQWALLTGGILTIGGIAGGFAGAWATPQLFFFALLGFTPWGVGVLLALLLGTVLLLTVWALTPERPIESSTSVASSTLETTTKSQTQSLPIFTVITRHEVARQSSQTPEKNINQNTEKETTGESNTPVQTFNLPKITPTKQSSPVETTTSSSSSTTTEQTVSTISTSNASESQTPTKNNTPTTEAESTTPVQTFNLSKKTPEKTFSSPLSPSNRPSHSSASKSVTSTHKNKENQENNDQGTPVKHYPKPYAPFEKGGS